MKNCRNCKWAEWYLTCSGRRRYGNYAPCTYPIDIKLPASRLHEAKSLKDEVGVREYRNIPVECETWEAKE